MRSFGKVLAGNDTRPAGNPRRRRLGNCKNLNGRAMQNVYGRCGCVGSFSLPVLEQEELSVCVNEKKYPCLVKRNDVGINWFVQKPPTFLQLSRHQEEEHMGTHLQYAKHSQVQKILRHLSPYGF